MEGKLRIAAEKVSTFDRMLNVNAKGLFRGFADTMIGLAKVGTSTSTSDLVNGLAGASEIISGVFTVVEGILSDEKDPVKHRAYVLLYNGMRRGLMTLIDQHLDAIKQATGKGYNAHQYQTLLDELDKKWNETSLQIDYHFFDDPGKFPFVHTLRGLVREWLIGLGLPIDEAKRIVLKLGPLMASALDALYKERPTYFAKVKAATQEDLGMSKEWQLYRYQQKLANEWKSNPIEGALGLDQLYIELNACYPVKIKDKEGKETTFHRVVASEQHILSWIDEENPEHKVIVLRGGPGSGKSSLMKKVVHEVVLQGERLVYAFQLQNFLVKENIEDAINSYLNLMEKDLLKAPKILDESNEGIERKPLLVFDGLDELGNCGGIANRNTERFISQIQALADSKTPAPRIIITGRDYVVQKYAANIVPSPQVLELLPLSIGEITGLPLAGFEEYYSYNFLDKEKLFHLNQRKSWILCYYAAKGQEIYSIPRPILSYQFAQLNRQPILLRLLAELAFDGQLNLESKGSLNKIYDRIFDNFWKRSIERIRDKRLDINEFLVMMEELALCVWHKGESRTASIYDVRSRCRDERMINLINTYFRISEPFEDLLLIFFTRWAGRSKQGEDLIEFTHKSFCEYLISTSVVRFVTNVTNEGSRIDHEFDSEFLSVLGKSAITIGIWRFLIEAIAIFSLGRKDNFKQIFGILNMMLKRFCISGFDTQRFKTSKDVMETSIIIELNLLLLITAISPQIEEKMHFPSLLELRMRYWLSSNYSNMFQQAMSWKEFPENFDFPFMKYTGTDFSDSQIKYSRFTNSIFSDVKFIRCNLLGATFTRIKIDSANFEDAILEGVCFSECEFEASIFRGVRMTHIKFLDCKVKSPETKGYMPLSEFEKYLNNPLEKNVIPD